MTPLNGSVIITGGPTRGGQSTPVPPWMVEIWKRSGRLVPGWNGDVRRRAGWLPQNHDDLASIRGSVISSGHR